eukprot:12900506-Prorocentrum_lima.AAC.1
MVERRHAILRQAFLKARASAEADGWNFDANQLLTEAVIALSHNGRPHPCRLPWPSCLMLVVAKLT